MAAITSIGAINTVGVSDGVMVPTSTLYTVALIGTSDFTGTLEVSIDGTNYFTPSALIGQAFLPNLLAYQLKDFMVYKMRLNITENTGTVSARCISL